MKKIFTLLFVAGFCCNVAAQGIYQLFGATGYGGPDDRGTLFTTRFDGTGHSIKKTFTVPNAGSPGGDNKPVFLNGKFYTVFDGAGINRGDSHLFSRSLAETASLEESVDQSGV